MAICTTSCTLYLVQREVICNKQYILIIIVPEIQRSHLCECYMSASAMSRYMHIARSIIEAHTAENEIMRMSSLFSLSLSIYIIHICTYVLLYRQAPHTNTTVPRCILGVVTVIMFNCSSGMIYASLMHF